MLSTLEVLQKARATLSDNEVPFDFGGWMSCTCGHVFAAANDTQPVAGIAASTEMRNTLRAGQAGVYADVIVEVAHACGWDGEPMDGHLPSTPAAVIATDFVSDYTDDLAILDDRSPDDHVTREHALAVVNKAIKNIEQREERQRLQVLAQMRDVVDGVDLTKDQVA